MTVRESVLLRGLSDWVALDRIHWDIARSMPNAPLVAIQTTTLDLIRSLVEEGLFEVGEVTAGSGFMAWTTSLEESVTRIRRVYVERFDDRDRWPWYCWLNLTDKGEQVARGTAAKQVHDHRTRPNDRNQDDKSRMGDRSEWRPISPEEAHVIRAILSSGGAAGGHRLIADLRNAQVRQTTAWIIDIKPPFPGGGCGLPDGPFPARAFVPDRASYRGEVIIWLNDGHLSGLEYAWIGDEPPARWPQPDEMQIEPRKGHT